MSALLTVLLATGCAGFDLDIKRATYQALRQSDCRLNELQEFCQQSYANEYREYATLRRNFMQERSDFMQEQLEADAL